MSSIYDFDASRNSEVRCSWYRLCLGAGTFLSHSAPCQRRIMFLYPVE